LDAVLEVLIDDSAAIDLESRLFRSGGRQHCLAWR
jgi:hypothetical protein